MKDNKIYIEKLAQEYQEINSLENISDLKFNRLEEILEIAESNCELNNLLNKIDLHLAIKQGLLNESNLNYLEEQRIKLVNTWNSKEDKNKALSILLF